MTDSQSLLTNYVRTGADDAFRELIARYLDLVYSTALRMVEGDAHRAKDVTQAVFVDLARMAGTLPDEVMLGGWLHRHTCFVAANVMRSERRRQSRERQAVEMNVLQAHPEMDFTRVAPILDEAINELGEADRTAILLRFFEQQDFRTVGEALGSGEDAARMRVNRALEKLESLLKRRGVTASSAALSIVLTANAVHAAPIGLVVTVSTAAALAGTTIASVTATTAKAIAMPTLQKTLITAAAVSLATFAMLQRQSQVSLRKENQSLRQQVEQLSPLAAENQRLASQLADAEMVFLPFPPTPALPPATAAPPEEPSTNVLSRLLNGDQVLRLTSTQAEEFLKENRRTAASLLAAYRTSGDQALLAEAMQLYPTNVNVAFEAAFKTDATPEERRHWLDVFKQAAPDNPMANYLSALNHFQSGQSDLAVQDFAAASGKKHFNDYTLDRIQGDEEAFRSAGYTEAETGMAATWGLVLPQLVQLRDAGQKMIELAGAYRQAGDEASAQAALRMVVNMGAQFDGSTEKAGVPLVSQLVGLALQRKALAALDPASSFSGNQSVQERIEHLNQQSESIKGLVKLTGPLQPRMSAQDWISYNDRTRTFGEENAIRWLTEKYPSE